MSSLNLFIYLCLCVCMCSCVYMCYSTHMEVRGYLSSLIRLDWVTIEPQRFICLLSMYATMPGFKMWILRFEMRSYCLSGILLTEPSPLPLSLTNLI